MITWHRSRKEMNSDVKNSTLARSTITFDGGWAFSGDRTTWAAVSIALAGRLSMAADTWTTATSPCRRKARKGSDVGSLLTLIPVPSHGLIGWTWSRVSRGPGRIKHRSRRSVEPEKAPDRLQQRRAVPLAGRLAQGGNRAVQQLVLVQPERRLDVLPVLLGQPPIQPAQER